MLLIRSSMPTLQQSCEKSRVSTEESTLPPLQLLAFLPRA
jgi:hypothetical protein